MSTKSTRALYVSRDLHGTKTKDQLKAMLTRGTDENKASAIWQMIKETGMGISHDTLLLTLTMVVPNTKDKRLIMLFYLYLSNIEIEETEGSIRDEILMVCNMIRGHLSHPNEHVRACAIRAVGRFRSASIFDVLKTPFIENISYSNPTVRTAVYVALRGLLRSTELSPIFSDVIPTVKEQVLSERDPIAVAEGYKTLEIGDPEGVQVVYEKLKETAHDGLQECFLRSAERREDPERVLEIFRSTKSRGIELEAAILLVKIGEDEKTVREAMDKLLERSAEYLDAESKWKIISACEKTYKKGRFSFDGMALQIGQMITPAVAKVDPELAQEIFKFVMEILAIVEARELFSYLLQSLIDTPVKEMRTVSDCRDKTFFINGLMELLKAYRLTSHSLVEYVTSHLSAGIPEIAMKSAEYLECFLTVFKEKTDEIILGVIEEMPTIQYGKILRRVFGLISAHATKSTAQTAVKKLFSSLESDETGLLPELKKPSADTGSKIFPGVSIASFLLGLCRHANNFTGQEQKEFAADIMAAALKTYAAGHKSGLLDESSKVALLRVANLLGTDRIGEITEITPESTKQKNMPQTEIAGSLKNRPSFSLVQEKGATYSETAVNKFIRKTPSVSLDKLKNVFQLTSAIDPLYCECQITTTRTEIILDILLVNQTDTLLEEIEFDIVSSPNIKMLSTLTLDKLRPHMLCTLEATLIMEESDTGFIGGVITAGKVGRENYFVQNLLEVVLNLSDMLQRKRISGDEFRKKWPTLLWENLYTISLSDSRITPNILLNSVVEEVNGTVVDTRTKEKGVIHSRDTAEPEIVVKNIYASTAQGTDIYINATVTKREGSVEGSFRIRGEKCGVVKSLCQLISKKMKVLS